jgi:hypothetical protein
MTFGERAAELAGLAASLLGWRPHEFWDATPVELATAFGMGGQDEAVVDSTELARLQSLFPDKRDR